MATRKKPSSHAREREFRKRQRERKKREKAALRIERRLSIRVDTSAVSADQRPDGENA